MKYYYITMGHNNTKKILILTLIFIILISPFAVFCIVFHKFSISNNIQDWSHFGNYINGTFMPIIALTGILVTLLLGIISDKRNKNLILIEQQKQRPLLHIDYFDGEKKIILTITNKGHGPLTISNYYLYNTYKKKFVSSIFEILPGLDMSYNNFSPNLNNYVLSIGETIDLLSIDIENEENPVIIKEFQSAHKKLRKILSDYQIFIEYNDIFGNPMPKYTRSLEWFNRYND